jgi:tripartite-type tricarboxylate transporter receptor subunit TctC
MQLSPSAFRRIGRCVPKAVIAVSLLGAPLSLRSLADQPYPNHPITVIVPLAAGGGTDIVARIVADRMASTLGQPLVVENLPNAAGTVGVSRLARATPDGYTIGIGDQTSFVVSSAAYKVSYNVLDDFEPISLLSTSPVLLVGRKTMPAPDLRGLIDWLKDNPEKATMATFGHGSGPHIIGVAFEKLTGTQLRAVPYRGVALAVQDVISGQVDLMFGEAAGMLPHIRSGAIKAYAVLADARVAAAPEIPAITEGGGPPLRITTWRGLWVPKGTPIQITARLHAAVVVALSDPGVQKRIADVGQEIAPPTLRTPQALSAHHRAEIAKWVPMVKAAGIEP